MTSASVSPSVSSHSPVEPLACYDLRCDGEAAPLGVDSEPPRLSWKLRGDGREDIFLREHGDKARLRPLRAARRQHRRAMKTKTAGDDGDVPESAFVPRHGAAWWVAGEILGQRPVQFAVGPERA